MHTDVGLTPLGGVVAAGAGPRLRFLAAQSSSRKNVLSRYNSVLDQSSTLMGHGSSSTLMGLVNPTGNGS